MDPRELAAALKRLVEWAHENAPEPEPEIRRRLREHLGAEPRDLEVVSADLTAYDHPNFQVAFEAATAGAGAPELIGLGLDHGFRAGLAELANPGRYGGALSPGPVEYESVDVGDRTIACLRSGLALLHQDGEPVAMLLAPGEHGEPGLRLEAMSPQRAAAEAWIARIQALMRDRNVYRGKVVSLGGGHHPFRSAPLTVRTLPEVRREQIVLPDGTLDRVERHTAGIARHSEALRSAGRHVKRGLLLHGPPGTGKTLTVMYLAALMPERTVVLLTGGALAFVAQGVGLARSLEPAMVVMEDVDLVARERSAYTSSPILFDLLNAMDGLDDDADLVFVLTTNRAELLEPALASRPGRIDLAVELPLPDARARRRLFDLYGAGLRLEVADWGPVVDATAGTSPAFVRELMRRAALHAAERGADAGTVTADHLLAAVAELRHEGGRLTASLLGAERPAGLAPQDDEAEGPIGFGWAPLE